MTKLNVKIKTALDESRMLVLGTQILLGFQYRSFFEKSFETAPQYARLLQLMVLGLLLIAIGLMMSTGSYHRIVHSGEDANEVHRFTTSVMNLALLPLLLALGVDVYLITARVWGERGGIVAGSVVATTSGFFWYGLGLVSRWRQWDSELGARRDHQESSKMKQTPIKDKVEQVLTEARVVLPGAQALLGFQLATVLMETFKSLPRSSQYVHALSLMSIGLTVILLMTPATYHRIVERGENTDHFHRVASALLLAAMVFLPIGICGEVYVVLRRLTDSERVAIGSALLSLLFFYGLWFGYTTYKRRRLSR